jgi:hypothetical protein
MTMEPQVLTEARRLVTLGLAAPWDELVAARDRMRSFAAHPSTSEDIAGRVLAALLLVDVLIAAHPGPVPALAS